MTISRREALAVTAALLASGQTRAADSRNIASKIPLKLGLVTYNWGKRWALPTLIHNCEVTGFTGIELRSTHQHGIEITLSSQQRQEVRTRFKDSPVELVGLGSACEYHSADPATLKKNIEETRQFLQLSHDLGASGVKVRPNALPKDVPEKKTIEQIGKSLNTVAATADDLGQQVRVEVHGRGTNKLPVMKAIMDVADHPSIGVCWNCNTSDMHGKGLLHNFQLVQDRMATVHIHDLRDDAYPWTELFSLLKQVEAKSFTGWTLLEDGRVPDDIVAAMHQNLPLWKALAS